MSQMIDGPRKTFLAAAAMGANLRVYISDATTTPPTVNLAGASAPSVGVTEAYQAAAGPISILLANAPGTRKMTCSEAITGGNSVYAAASGEVASTGTVVEGKAMETTTDDGDIFEVLGTHNSDISTAIAGTTAVGFEVDTDSATPKIKLLAVAAGTGNFTTTISPESTLSADNTITVPEADGDTLAAIALAQTLTNKTLTAPVITAPAVTGAATGLTITKIVPFIENATNTIHTGTVPIPAGAVLLNIQVVNTVLWGAASASLVVGDDDVANGFLTATNCKATDLLVGEVFDISNAENWGGKNGAYLVAATGRKGNVDTGNSGIYYAASNNVIGIMTVGTPAATTGRTLMAVTYCLPETIAAVATGP